MEGIRLQLFSDIPCHDQTKGEKKGRKEKKGNLCIRFGNTYFFGFFPLRIDYIFVDKRLKVSSFSTFDENLSDHNPIMAKIDFN